MIKLDQLDILDVGNAIQLAGAVWTSNDQTYIAPFPGEVFPDHCVTLQMDSVEWERFLQQSDVLDVRCPNKAILRKSQRMIDQNIAWRVYERDDYRCRYCGRKAPLTVDHVITWESGGATVPENLISACRTCNKARGNMEYEAWLASPQYQERRSGLTVAAMAKNDAVVKYLPELRQIKAKPRSR